MEEFDKEDLQDAREMIEARRHQSGCTWEEAHRKTKKLLAPEHYPLIDAALKRIQEDAARTRKLRIPSKGIYEWEEERVAHWYAGPRPADRIWPRLKASLEGKFPDEDFLSLDRASTKVVGSLADPFAEGLKKRGLVLGYVQSGKTANYTSVIAKAADAGYRFVIVLAGMHNNLRRQTQTRLLNDLFLNDWVQLTDEDRDFGGAFPGSPHMANPRTRMLAVVKKNATRLEHLKKWLSAISEDIRSDCPILLLDDEADQATPNTAASRKEMSAINRLLREIWGLIPTGSYVGYTATPFANIFMNPDDELELYPADFIIDLPRPAAYFGAERLFGNPNPEDGDQQDDGLDAIRVVPEEDSRALTPGRPPSDWEAVVPDSLESAIQWFVLATAIRRARGHDNHSSMLIHTTHYIRPHAAMKREVEEFLVELREYVDSGVTDSLQTQFEVEKDRSAGVRTEPMPTFSEVSQHLPQVMRDIKVIVDNGESEERLDYNPFNSDGSKAIQTVIAIGGGTLSRGLTLEGLCVSYFNRTSNTYDTLLQMGRWFGYRPGYEDLQRIWATESLREDFEFLGIVEAELRSEIRTMELQEKTPRELGVRVRAHPGRLEITSRAKMHFAREVDPDFSGDFRQTFILHEADRTVIDGNSAAARKLIQRGRTGSVTESGLGQVRQLWRGLSTEAVLEFINAYETHPDQMSLRRDLLSGWLRQKASSATWNVGLASNSPKSISMLGCWDAGLDEPVPMINRAPLKTSKVGVANIKTLRSAIDRVADLPSDLVRGVPSDEIPAVRSALVPNEGLIVIYPISHESQPTSAARRRMHAPAPLIGYSISFPSLGTTSDSERSYWAVQPQWEVDLPDIEEELPRDLEGDMPVHVPEG